MDPARALKKRRLELGISETEIASFIGIQEQWYCDLEMCKDELKMNLSLGALFKLCSRLSIRPCNLFNCSSVISNYSIAELSNDLQAVREKNTSVDDFHDKIGWDLSEFYLDNVAVFNWSVDQLIDVSSAVGKKWDNILENLYDEWKQVHGNLNDECRT